MSHICKALLPIVTLISINLSSQTLIPCKSEDPGNKKFGYCDSATGKNKIEYKFDSAYRFVKGMARVMINNKFGFINTQGVLKIAADYEKAADFSEGFAAVKKENKYFFIDQNNTNPFGRNYYFMNPKTLAAATKQQLKQFGDPLSSFSNGLALAYDTSGYAGYINTKGVFAITPKYLAAASFGDGVAMVQESRNEPIKAIDQTGKVLFELPTGWFPTEPFSGNTAIVQKGVKNNAEYNVVNKNGKLIFSNNFIEVNRFSKTYFEIYKTYGHCGIGNAEGQIIINSDTSKIFGILGKEVDPAGNYRAFLYDERTSNKLGDMTILSKSFKPITSRSYNFIMDYKDGFYQPYQRQTDRNLLFGLLSKEGKELLPPDYRLIRYNTTDKLIFVKNNNGNEGLYDYSGKPILKEEFSSIDNWDTAAKSKILIVTKGGKRGLANKSGKMLTPIQYQNISLEDYYGTSNSYYEIQKDDKKGIMDLSGKEVVTPQYDELYPEFEEGCPFFSVGKDMKFGWIDKTGKVLLPLIYASPVSCPGKELAAPASLSDSSYVYVNKAAQVLFGKKFQWASYFDNGIAYVKEKGKLGFINSKGSFIVTPAFDDISAMTDNTGAGDKVVLYRVKQGDKWGFFNATAKQLTPVQFDDPGEEMEYTLSDKLVAVKLNGKWGYIDVLGKLVIAAVYENAGAFTEGKAEVDLNGKKVTIDKKGNVNPD